MRLIDKIMNITGGTEEECYNDCPFNHEVLAQNNDWQMYCDDCETCLNQIIE